MKFETTKLNKYYYHELHYLAYQIDKKCKLVFDNTQPLFPGAFIQNDPETHSIITSLLNDAAGISRLISLPKKKSKSETAPLFALRTNRAETINAFLESIDITEIQNRTVRNSVEHFDEHLDRLNLRLSNDPFDPPPIAYNLTISDWDIYEPKLLPIKLYVVSEKKFYNMGNKVDLNKIHEEAEQILKKCSSAGISHIPMGLFPSA
ncbi:hypothetical protein KMS_R19980 [Pseudomonas sp. LRP2-20]|uniref:hypothetical protein n=1 Tax=Pseudomonas sp. LRP2-20 TaxID=2944234 RepID=UPI0021858E7F|nr:hypothetical protein [Pseudomonas sp. LRP2-20]BDM22240.1 hypothetical protein KMS_R19980 [Pseudomonas sp. LRP2-20]